MTDRIRHLTVILDRDYRDDDVEPIVEAIKQLRGVSAVTEHVVKADQVIARMTVCSQLYNKTIEAVHDVFYDKDGEPRSGKSP